MLAALMVAIGSKNDSESESQTIGNRKTGIIAAKIGGGE
jgi:hypothetical protein